MKLLSNAKINFGLNILRKRPDNFHDIQSIFLPIGLSDNLEINEAREFSIKVEGMDHLNEETTDNLCSRAYQLFRKEYSLPAVDIRLKKNIPIGAGLGGGSSNAAFVLKGLNQLFDLGLDSIQLQQIASKLGSDCAFFIENRPALGSGKGDELQPVELDLKYLEVILVNPGIHISTAEAYAGVVANSSNFSLQGISQLSRDEWQQKVVNDFEKSIFRKHPELSGIKEQFLKAGAIYSSMSGSGASVYGLFEKSSKTSMEWPKHYFHWKGSILNEGN